MKGRKYPPLPVVEGSRLVMCYGCLRRALSRHSQKCHHVSAKGDACDLKGSKVIVCECGLRFCALDHLSQHRSWCPEATPVKPRAHERIEFERLRKWA